MTWRYMSARKQGRRCGNSQFIFLRSILDVESVVSGIYQSASPGAFCFDVLQRRTGASAKSHAGESGDAATGPDADPRPAGATRYGPAWNQRHACNAAAT